MAMDVSGLCLSDVLVEEDESDMRSSPRMEVSFSLVHALVQLRRDLCFIDWCSA